MSKKEANFLVERKLQCKPNRYLSRVEIKQVFCGRCLLAKDFYSLQTQYELMVCQLASMGAASVTSILWKMLTFYLLVSLTRRLMKKMIMVAIGKTKQVFFNYLLLTVSLYSRDRVKFTNKLLSVKVKSLMKSKTTWKEWLLCWKKVSWSFWMLK